MDLTILIINFVGLGLSIGLLFISLVYAIEKNRLKPVLFNWILITNIALILLATISYLSVKIILYFEWNTDKYASQTFYSAFGAFLHIIWISILCSFLLYTIMAFLDRFSTTLRCSMTGWIMYILILTIFPIANMLAVVLSSEDGVSAYIPLLQPYNLNTTNPEEDNSKTFTLILTGVVGLAVLTLLFVIGLSVNVWCFSQRIIMSNDYNRMAFTFKWLYINLPLTIGIGFFFRESQTSKTATNVGFAFFPIVCLVQALVITYLVVFDKGNMFQKILRKRVQARINRKAVPDNGPPSRKVDELDGVGMRNHRSRQELVELKVTRAMNSAKLSGGELTRNNFVGAIYQNQDEIQAQSSTKKRLFIKREAKKPKDPELTNPSKTVSNPKAKVSNQTSIPDEKTTTPPPKPARLKGDISFKDQTDFPAPHHERSSSKPQDPELKVRNAPVLQTSIKPDLEKVPYSEPIAASDVVKPQVKDFNDAISQLRKSNNEIIAELNKKEALRVQSLYDRIYASTTLLHRNERQQREEDLSQIEPSKTLESDHIGTTEDHDVTVDPCEKEARNIVVQYNDTETENALVEAIAFEEERQRIKKLKKRNKAKRKKRRAERKALQNQQDNIAQVPNDILNYEDGIIYLDRDRTQDEMVTEI